MSKAKKKAKKKAEDDKARNEHLATVSRHADELRGRAAKFIASQGVIEYVECDEVLGESITIFCVEEPGVLTIGVVDIDDEDVSSVKTVRITEGNVIQRAVDRLKIAIQEYDPS